jgi:hypothetical protein
LARPIGCPLKLYANTTLMFTKKQFKYFAPGT